MADRSRPHHNHNSRDSDTASFSFPSASSPTRNCGPIKTTAHRVSPNFFRNWGGSFGIAITTTVADRRDQLHQSTVGALITATSQQLAAQTHALADYSVTKGFTGADAALAAQGRVFTQLERQVQLLSFMDCFRVLGYVTAAVLPLVLAIRHVQSAGKAPVVE